MAASSPKASEAAASAAAPADKLRLLLDLVEDPDLRSYLEQRRPGATAQTVPDPSNTMAGGLGDGLQHLRNRIRALAEAVPRLPGQVANAGGMLTDMLGRGDAISLALFLPVFVALGLGGEWLFRDQHARRPALADRPAAADRPANASWRSSRGWPTASA